MKVHRRLVSAGLLGATLPMFAIRTARSADTVFKYGNSIQPGNPVITHMQAAAKSIAEETGGRLQMQLYPSGALGGDTEMLSQLRTGGLQCMTLSAGVLSTLVPLAAVNEVPFAFKDADSVYRTMDGPLGAQVRAAIGRTKLVALERMWSSGFRAVTSSRKPIETPDDLKGFKIRVPVFQMAVDLFRTLGASPVSLNSTELYSALQTKVADGQENSLTNVETFKLYEIQSFVSVTNHMWDGYWFLFNGEAWGKLPPDVQEVAGRRLNEAASAERAAMEKLNADQKPVLEKQGMKFNAVDTAPFREKLRAAGFYTNWKKRFGDEAWSALESSVGTLT